VVDDRQRVTDLDLGANRQSGAGGVERAVQDDQLVRVEAGYPELLVLVEVVRLSTAPNRFVGHTWCVQAASRTES
jgi:hypothetical protein